jgi:hypothetical protein
MRDPFTAEPENLFEVVVSAGGKAFSDEEMGTARDVETSSRRPKKTGLPGAIDDCLSSR